ncbi:hypothetical protein C9374_013188 [Naegleria lovaniensis]|uniref:Uncharacterized protein n=1 Tax=Naegleria lovaniensis TaxID=51637 RepID=A0AA88GEU5_NAELO|nr:uncharacterized protein C9374_013188 [Naegleria lovaniensis]KAG2372736.1 hypothetical protein C9374_013188 [Naegleria lovaniensis]
MPRNSKEQVDDDRDHHANVSNVTTIAQNELLLHGGVSIPPELWLHMAQYIGSLKDLLSFALCHSHLLQLLFNQNLKLKTTTSSEFILQMSPTALQMKFGKVDKSQWNQMLMNENDLFQVTQQQVWKSLVCYYFPNFEKSLNVKNWMHVLKRRIQHLKLYTPQLLPLKPQISSAHFTLVSFTDLFIPKGDDLFIENCEWIYKCPLKYEELNEGNHIIKGSSQNLPDIQFCSVCSKNVYLVRNQVELKDHVLKGNCVAYTSEPKQVFPRLMGSIAYNPRFPQQPTALR